LFYRTVGGRVDVNPTARVTWPDMSVHDADDPRRLDDGLFCLELRFVKEGTYLVTFHENGLLTTIQHLEIRRDGRRATGDKLINP